MNGIKRNADPLSRSAALWRAHLVALSLRDPRIEQQPLPEAYGSLESSNDLYQRLT